MSLNQLILSTLRTIGAPVSYLNHAGNETTYVTFFEYDQGAGIEADDNEQSSIHYIHLDIFSPGNFLNLVNKVKKEMKQAGFVKTAETEMYEQDTKLYHKVLRFYFITENEEEE